MCSCISPFKRNHGLTSSLPPPSPSHTLLIIRFALCIFSLVLDKILWLRHPFPHSRHPSDFTIKLVCSLNLRLSRPQAITYSATERLTIIRLKSPSVHYLLSHTTQLLGLDLGITREHPCVSPHRSRHCYSLKSTAVRETVSVVCIANTLQLSHLERGVRRGIVTLLMRDDLPEQCLHS